MGDKTGIQWTDATWNPIRGCSRVSEGCRNCYAETVANRFKGPGQPYEGLIARGGQWNGQIMVVDHLMDQPLRWKKPRRIFVNSMSDPFHESVPDETINRIFEVMESAKRHTFQILTKRPQRMYDFVLARLARKKLYADQFDNCPTEAMRNSPAAQWARASAASLPAHIWLGVSIEDQKTADERIPLLLQTPAAVRWISAEPLLGGVWLAPYLSVGCALHRGPQDEAGQCEVCSGKGIWEGAGLPQPTTAARIDWVVVGGESGFNARPMHPQWARTLRDQCQAAGTPFFFKQWGEWRAPLEGEKYDTSMGRAQRVPAFIVAPSGTVHCFENEKTKNGGEVMLRAGKKQAGRLLDGREWNEYPDAAS